MVKNAVRKTSHNGVTTENSFIQGSMHTHTSRQYRACVDTSDVSSKYVAIIHWTTASHSLRHPSLHTYIHHSFNSNNFLFTYLSAGKRKDTSPVQQSSPESHFTLAQVSHNQYKTAFFTTMFCVCNAKTLILSWNVAALLVLTCYHAPMVQQIYLNNSITAKKISMYTKKNQPVYAQISTRA